MGTQLGSLQTNSGCWVPGGLHPAEGEILLHLTPTILNSKCYMTLVFVITVMIITTITTMVVIRGIPF